MPLQYLGFNFDGQDTRIRPSSIDKNTMRMQKAVFLSRRKQRSRNKKLQNKGLACEKIYLRKLNRNYGRFGAIHDAMKVNKNFYAYGSRSAKRHNSKRILKQLERRSRHLVQTIRKTTNPKKLQP